MRAKRDPEETPGIMMEPMIDCVFLLLIFFLVAATIRKKHSELPITLPQGENAVVKKAPDETLVVAIVHNKRNPMAPQYAVATVGEQLRSTGGAREYRTLQELINELRARALENPNRKVRIDANTGVPYGAVIQVIDHCELYRLKNIGLRTRDQFQG